MTPEAHRTCPPGGTPLNLPSLTPHPTHLPWAPLALWFYLKYTSQKNFGLDEEGREMPHLQSPYWSCRHYSSSGGCSTWAPPLCPRPGRGRNKQTNKWSKPVPPRQPGPMLAPGQQIIHIWRQELGVLFTWLTPSWCKGENERDLTMSSNPVPSLRILRRLASLHLHPNFSKTYTSN